MDAMADLPYTERKLILYISMSLDGFIATEDDDLSWLSVVEKEGEDYGSHRRCLSPG
jgi:hypothetical protein